MLPDWFFLCALGLFGLLFGSFGNVVIWRLPRGESLASPGSRCPVCDTPIAWYDNVPVLSWLLLRARCRQCGAAISPRYPLVELLSAVLWVAAGAAFGQTWSTLAAIVMFYVLLLLSFIDWDTMRLPNPLVAVLAGFGLAAAVASVVSEVPIAPLTPWLGVPLPALSTALIGAALGAAVSLGIALLYSAVRNLKGFGAGDVKLLAAMGVYLGPYVLMAFFAGSVLGAVYGVSLAATHHTGIQRRFPFGPFLAIGGALTALFGPTLWQAYTGLFS